MERLRKADGAAAGSDFRNNTNGVRRQRHISFHGMGENNPCAVVEIAPA
jgi:hypothetical protein